LCAWAAESPQKQAVSTNGIDAHRRTQESGERWMSQPVAVSDLNRGDYGRDTGWTMPLFVTGVWTSLHPAPETADYLIVSGHRYLLTENRWSPREQKLAYRADQQLTCDDPASAASVCGVPAGKATIDGSTRPREPALIIARKQHPDDAPDNPSTISSQTQPPHGAETPSPSTTIWLPAI
jgi:hypothetical protein